MRLRINARNLDLPERTKRELAEDVERLTRFYDGILAAEVTVAQERHRHVVDVRLHVNGKSYQAEASEEAVKPAFEAALGKLRRQLQRHKERLRRQSLRGDEAALRGGDGRTPEVPPLPDTGQVPRRLRGARVPRDRG